MKVVRFKPHSDKQDDLIFSNARLTIAATGTQWGKSQGGALWFKRQIHETFNAESNYLLMAPTYKIMNQSMVPYFLNAMEGFGEYKKSEALFKLPGGGAVYFRTEKDPDSIVGIPKVKAFWLDEAGKVGLYFWENVQARAAAVGARGLLTTSPYSRNWLYKDFVKPILGGKMADIKFIKAASWENPYHTMNDAVERERIKSQMDPRRFDALFGGEWGQMAGLVYDCFDDVQNMVKPFQFPHGTRFFGGIDWGFTDPFVLKIRAITPNGFHFLISEFYKSGLTINDQVQVAKQKRSLWPIECFFAGPDRPDNIEEFNRNGLPCIPANNSIRLGIDKHYELIKTRRFLIFEGVAPYTVDEIESYHYPEPEDLGPDDDSQDLLPVGQNDHALDADRYLTIMTFDLGEKKVPTSKELDLGIPAISQESFEQRIKRLKRKSSDQRTERFS